MQSPAEGWDAVGMSCACLGGADEGWESWEAAPAPPYPAREFSHSCIPRFCTCSHLLASLGCQVPTPRWVCGTNLLRAQQAGMRLRQSLEPG